MTFNWSDDARRDLRAIPRLEALLILRKLAAWRESGRGDVKKLRGFPDLYRLRVGKWRVIFDQKDPADVYIHGIDNRGEAY